MNNNIEKDLAIITKSFELFLHHSLFLIESDDIQIGLFNAIDEYKAGTGTAYIQIKDNIQLNDPCEWLLSRTKHPSEYDTSTKEGLMASRTYEIIIELDRKDYKINAMYSLIKPPFTEGVIHHAMIYQWIERGDQMIQLNEKRGDIFSCIFSTKK
jgi:hypothetical protein